MDVSNLINDLNDAQREAVTAPFVNQLVLAGAGSGKTRVLVHRIAWLIKVENLSPWSVLAVTFTNKAANEMRQRIEALLQIPTRGLWVGTFHSVCHRLLRQHFEAAGLPKNFQILDSQDQQRLIKRVIKSLDLDESKWPAKQAQGFINQRKDEALRPKNIQDQGDPLIRQLVRIYAAYEAACERNGVIDFAELMLRTLEMFNKNADLRAHYQERFRYLMVDEFQDTNTIQYALLRVLSHKSNFVFAVGDDDQAIYGWRGARIENIQHFTEHFADTQITRLEQNYRSTGHILNAANALIDHNEDRLGKQLWTSDGDGQQIDVYTAFNETDEAYYVAERIQRWISHGGNRSEVAVLYRSNAQSRMFEETFISQNIPYRVYGGLRFFERAEIKDALAYLRLSVNRSDDASFDRIVNTPTRGIGEKTLEFIRSLAQREGVSYLAAAEQAVQQQSLRGRAANAVSQFLTIMQTIIEKSADASLMQRIEVILEHSTLLATYEKSKNDADLARKENLEELISAAKAYDQRHQQNPDQDMTVVDAFLSYAVLESGEGQADVWEDCVQLMTLHSAKGLEFPLVFLCGLEEGLFPHQMSLDEPGRLAEERRLCYVGITRARQQLVLSHAETRRLYGREIYCIPSRFVNEIPTEHLNPIRSTMVSQYDHHYKPKKTAFTQTEDLAFKIGQTVRHPKFGAGIVLGCEGQGNNLRVQVNFEEAGNKWLVLAYANLSAA